ncbi:MAG: hypothetical protein RL397_1093 [Pseudomonadota bacterium]
MKKTLLAVTMAALALPVASQAAESELSGNMSITSDYRFRGISQSNKQPALQGGIDYAHSSGLYIGNWNSSVSQWASNLGAGIEMDVYAGYSTEVGGLGVDVGTIYYYYPNARVSVADAKNHANTQEAYIGLSYGIVTFKTSYTLSDRYFTLGTGGDTTLQSGATPSSKGTLYYDLSLSYELTQGISLSAHAGSLSLKNKVGSSIKDYSVGVAYALKDWELGLSVYSTSGLNAADKAFFTTLDGKSTKLYGSGAAVSLSRSF